MNTDRTHSPTRLPFIGACYGAVTWLSYGVLELCCIAVLPRIVEPGYEYRAYDARFSALVLLFYAALGAAIGFVSGVIAPRVRKLQKSEPAFVVGTLNTAI